MVWQYNLPLFIFHVALLVLNVPCLVLQELSSFTLEKAEDGGVKMETGKGKCPFEPTQHYTAVMAGGTLHLHSH